MIIGGVVTGVWGREAIRQRRTFGRQWAKGKGQRAKGKGQRAKGKGQGLWEWVACIRRVGEVVYACVCDSKNLLKLRVSRAP